MSVVAKGMRVVAEGAWQLVDPDGALVVAKGAWAIAEVRVPLLRCVGHC